MFSIIRHHPKAVFWAIVVHVVFAVIMGVSFTFFNPRMLNIQDSDIIRAVTVDPVEVKQRIKQQKAREKKKRKQKKKIALQKKREAEKKRIAKEKKQRELELKQKLEQEVKQREQAKREDELRKEMEVEQAKLAAERRKQQLTIIDKYRALIDASIRKNWLVPAVAKPEMLCKIKVQLIPSGEVINIRISSSSGNAVYDRSVEVAIRKASPLPLPPAEYGLFDEFRDITFRVSPQKIN